MTILGHFNEKIDKVMIKGSRKNTSGPGHFYLKNIEISDPDTGPGHFYLKIIKISDPCPGTGTGKSPIQSPGHLHGHFPRPVVSRSCPGTVLVMSRSCPGTVLVMSRYRSRPVPDRSRSVCQERKNYWI